MSNFATVAVVMIGVVCAIAGAATAYLWLAARQAGDAEASAAAPWARERTEDQLLDLFRAVSSTAVQEQSEQLLRLAETRYQTLEQSAEAKWRAQGETLLDRLTEYSARLHRLEAQRQRESAVLSAAVTELRRSTEAVRDEARGLAAAMNHNKARGSWGEMQLRRVLEVSGMEPHSDFVEQKGFAADGVGEPGTAGHAGAARPDVVVRLPNDRRVVIDAKAPLDSYLRASGCEDPAEREHHLAEHARAVAGHVGALARRRYDEIVDGAVDFVVLFIPGDAFLSAAFEARPELLEEATRQNVVLASPSTLIAFLRGVATGWRERQIAEEAEEIARLGRELHERIAVFGEHFCAVGAALGRSVAAYNQALGSMERRLLVTARRFAEHGVESARAVPEASGISDVPGSPSSPELLTPPNQELGVLRN